MTKHKSFKKKNLTLFLSSLPSRFSLNIPQFKTQSHIQRHVQIPMMCCPSISRLTEELGHHSNDYTIQVNSVRPNLVVLPASDSSFWSTTYLTSSVSASTNSIPLLELIFFFFFFGFIWFWVFIWGLVVWKMWGLLWFVDLDLESFGFLFQKHN